MIGKALDQLSSASGQLQKEQQNNGDAAKDGEGAPQQRKPLWTGVVTNKSAKSQALDAMKALIAWQPIPVMRARMRLRVTCPVSLLKQSVKGSATSKQDQEGTQSNSKSNKKGGK
jgi:ribosome maturation protein SDO1